MHIVIAGGGTLGHLAPGLAVAEELRDRDSAIAITFAGSGKPLERRLVAEAGFDYLCVACQPLPHGPREAVAFVFENVVGYFSAARFLAESAVDAVVGMGGYASVPMGRAAARRELPLVLLEQNATPGRATCWLAPHAAAICLAIPEAEAGLPRSAAIHWTGNPLRPGFRRDFPARNRRQLLVLGGSGGARSLNENVPKALYKLGAGLRDWHIVHQTGEVDHRTTAALYAKLDLKARVVPLVHDMPAMLAATSLAVCRAGGSTLAELAAAGVPSLMLPYPHAKDDHQRRNAELFAAAGGGVLLDEREVNGRLADALAERLAPLVEEPGRRERMSILLRRLARPDAAAEVADLVLSIASRRLASVAA